jgi:hypothetical protein
MNYGDNASFNRQHNLNGWIITSTDFGKTWKLDATKQNFFEGRVASAHFIQFGKDNGDASDGYVYAYFPAADDGNAYWENNDYLLLGRVPSDQILVRSAWRFFAGKQESGQELWDADAAKAAQVFRYPHMTGEDHVTYNPGLKRFILANYGFHWLPRWQSESSTLSPGQEYAMPQPDHSVRVAADHGSLESLLSQRRLRDVRRI